ncbi:MAG: ricin-type beta-trefoil lectin domain protein [Deltaproteobacteria bacterium]|nr:ricin-type beta-trefoil lectin domain protein [Deltaproteobacteria bacterium]
MTLGSGGCERIVGIHAPYRFDAGLPVDTSTIDVPSLDPVATDGPGEALIPSGDAATGDAGPTGLLAGVGTLVVRHTGNCLDVRGPLTAFANPGLQQASCDGSPEQDFRFRKNPDGTYVIAPASPIAGATAADPGCVDVEKFSLTNGASIIAYLKYNGTANQKWIVNEVDGPYFKLSNQLSGRCLEANPSQAEGIPPIQQWECSDDVDAGIPRENQMWKFVLKH